MLATLLCQSVGPASDLIRSEANQQTDTRELSTYLRSEANQQTGTRELQTDLGSEDNQQTVVNYLVPFC
jgi:hypothetical protein